MAGKAAMGVQRQEKDSFAIQVCFYFHVQPAESLPQPDRGDRPGARLPRWSARWPSHRTGVLEQKPQLRMAHPGNTASRLSSRCRRHGEEAPQRRDKWCLSASPLKTQGSEGTERVDTGSPGQSRSGGSTGHGAGVAQSSAGGDLCPRPDGDNTATRLTPDSPEE